MASCGRRRTARRCSTVAASTARCLWCHGTWYVYGVRTVVPAPGASCSVPQVRTARRRLVRVAHTYSTEAPGRTCKLRLPPAQSLEQVRPGAEEAAALLLRRLLRLGGAPRSRQEQQPSPALRAAAEQHAQPRPGGRAVGAGASARRPGVVCSWPNGKHVHLVACAFKCVLGAPSWRRLAEERTAVEFSRGAHDEQAAGDEHAYGGR